MKIAVNTLFFIPGEVGGSETYLCETLQAVALHNKEIEISLITNSENHALLLQRFGAFDQFSFVKMRLRAMNRYARILAEQLILPRVVKRVKPDLLWSPGYTVPLMYGGRQSVTIHDMQYKTHPDDLGFIARITTDLLVRGAVRSCEQIIAISEFSKSEIIAQTSAKEEQISVTLEGVNTAFSKQLYRINTQNEPWSRGTVPHILCVANSYPHKNLHGLVDAFAQVYEKFDANLVIVGKKRLGEPLLENALQQIPSERVIRLERVAYEQLVALYQKAAVFVFPSLYEGFGLPVLEAMMARTPVVTTREASLPEVGGDCAVYADGRNSVDLAEKIMQVLAWSAEERRAWTERAYAHAMHFTWQATAEKTVDAWSRLVE
jgi:glycosyltransferase involved in cell wall biosynthesis